MSDQNEDDRWQDRWMAEVQNLGDALGSMRTTNPWPDVPLLPAAMNYLMTELWDRGFSQTEIREAFEAAALDLPRYAAGVERRS
jgi:broad-specificity NMP kinase